MAMFRRRWSLGAVSIAILLTSVGYLVVAPAYLGHGFVYGHENIVLLELQVGSILQSAGWLLASAVAFASIPWSTSSEPQAASGSGRNVRYPLALGTGFLLIGTGTLCIVVNPISNWQTVGILCALAGGTIVACTVLALAAQQVRSRAWLLILSVGTSFCIVGLFALYTDGTRHRSIGLPCVVAGSTIVACTVLALAARRIGNRRQQFKEQRATADSFGPLVAVGLALLLAVLPDAVLPPLNGFGPPLATMAYGELAVCFAVIGAVLFLIAPRSRNAGNVLVAAGGGLIVAMLGTIATGALGQLGASSVFFSQTLLMITTLITAAGLAVTALAVGLLAIRAPRSPADPGDRLWVSSIALDPG